MMATTRLLTLFVSLGGILCPLVIHRGLLLQRRVSEDILLSELLRRKAIQVPNNEQTIKQQLSRDEGPTMWEKPVNQGGTSAERDTNVGFLAYNKESGKTNIENIEKLAEADAPPAAIANDNVSAESASEESTYSREDNTNDSSQNTVENKTDDEVYLESNKELVTALLKKGIYRSKEELLERRERFPSVDKRARVYLSSWYSPPCSDEQRLSYNIINQTDATEADDRNLILLREFPRSQNQTSRTFIVPRYPEQVKHMLNKIFHGDPEILRACKNCNHYVPDAVDYVIPAWDRLVKQGKTSHEKPLLFFWGDSEYTRGFTVPPSMANQKLFEMFPYLPVIMKYRNVADWKSSSWMAVDKDACRSEPKYPSPVSVITKMKSHRHYKPIETIPKWDLQWADKKSLAVWRGAVRGITNHFSEADLRKKQPLERCMSLPRCRLVYNTANSTLVDAALAGSAYEGLMPETIEEKTIFKQKMDKEQMLQYKAIIMLEGNDMSTGLKWALFSNSVVMMPKPTRTSWAMEELLEPWVHYIPLNDELDDAEEKMRWAIEHDQEAQKIARRGTLWMTDMLYHPDAKRDEEMINEEIVRRYQSHFKLDPTLIWEDKTSLEQNSI